ncbi:MAG TPA: hypothetical protein VLA11_05845 [Woeseiaceae bacterium]|jgi:hypothetical protein|nr:hypothetical protein [Woeseiaceae bacterium]
MLRLIGILTGSAIAIALLIIAIGIPALTPPDDAEFVAEPLSLAPVSEQIVPAAAPEVADSPPAELPETPAVAKTEPELEAVIEELFAEREPVEEHWYAFWSPFRSEIAANGFVARLQEKTGIDYRVVKVKTGVYEVAFAYIDDADIQSKLELITTATGLDMSGG